MKRQASTNISLDYELVMVLSCQNALLVTHLIKAKVV